MASSVDLGLPDYRDYYEVGRGGFGAVYRAYHPGLDRWDAVKVIERLTDDDVRRFEREARTQSRLSHPGIVKVHNFTRGSGGRPCIIMEFLPDGSLADALGNDGPMPIARAVKYVEQLAEAISFAHGRDVLHRDIKPANVMIDALHDQAKLSDFGLTATVGLAVTQGGHSAEHAPPEVLRTNGFHGDVRSDLYSLASTFFALLVGQSPYYINYENDPEALRERVLNDVPPAVGGSVELGDFFDRALAKDPDDRYQDGRQFLHALQRIPRSDAMATVERWAEPELTEQQAVAVDALAIRGSDEQRREVARLSPTQSVLHRLAFDSDQETSEVAISRLTDPGYISELVAAEQPNRRIRIAAAARVTDPDLARVLAKDEDVEVRAALAGAFPDRALSELFLHDPSEKVRGAFIGQTKNTETLKVYAKADSWQHRRTVARYAKPHSVIVHMARDVHPEVRAAALARVQDRTVVFDLAKDEDEGISWSAMQFVPDLDSLQQLARNDTGHVSKGAIARIDDDEVLIGIAGDPSHPGWRHAMARVTGSDHLRELAWHTEFEVASAALHQITDPDLLTELVLDGRYPLRVGLVDRITDPETLLRLTEDPVTAERAHARLALFEERNTHLKHVVYGLIGGVAAALVAAPMAGISFGWMLLLGLALLAGGLWYAYGFVQSSW